MNSPRRPLFSEKITHFVECRGPTRSLEKLTAKVTSTSGRPPKIK